MRRRERDAGYAMRDTGCGIRDAGCAIRDTPRFHTDPSASPAPPAPPARVQTRRAVGSRAKRRVQDVPRQGGGGGAGLVSAPSPDNATGERPGRVGFAPDGSPPERQAPSHQVTIASFIYRFTALALTLIIPLTSQAASLEPVNPPAEGVTLPLQLDFETAIRLAYRYNPTLREARERLREQQGLMTATESVRLPKFDAYGNYQVEDEGRLDDFGGGQDETSWGARVELTQPLFSGGRLAAQVRSQRETGRSLVERLQAIQMQVLTDTIERFYDGLLAREQIKVQEESLDLIEQQLALAQNRYQAGAAPRFDVLQSEVRVANAKPPLIRARNAYRLAVEDLRATLGLPYPDGHSAPDVELTGAWLEPTQPVELDALLEEALEQRPELAEIRHQTLAVEADLVRASRQRMPRIDGIANYGIRNDRFSEDDETLEGWLVGVQASLPIWEGGRIRGEVAQAKSRLEQIRLREQEARLAIEVEVRQALFSVQEAREILDAADQTIEQASEAVRLAENRYRAGGATQLDVLSSQVELTRARTERITAARDYQIQLVRLHRAVGRMPGERYLDEAENIALPSF